MFDARNQMAEECLRACESVEKLGCWSSLAWQIHLLSISNVGKIIVNNPPVITINRRYKLFPNGWFILVLTTLNHIK